MDDELADAFTMLRRQGSVTVGHEDLLGRDEAVAAPLSNREVLFPFNGYNVSSHLN